MQISKYKSALYILPMALLSLGIIFQNCSKVSVSDISSQAAGKSGVGNGGGFVCSPFDPNNTPTAQSGLKTELRYISPSANLSVAEKNNLKARNYFDRNNPNLVQVPAVLYLPDVNVPTRQFQNGFQTSNSALIRDNEGHVLIEYFGLRMESVLQLGPSDPEGYYEIALLSDDGVVLQIKENNQWTDAIDNDGPHSTSMGCMNRRIHLSRSSRIPIQLYYNQGPRTHISNVMIWNYRGLDAHGTPSSGIGDSEIRGHCGRASSENFWNPDSNQEGPWIQDIWNQGWKVLTPANFSLPNNETNPCAN